jgi:hypothetical protein
MNPDLYGAWLTAGNNLQPIGDWLGRNWIWLGAAVVAAGVAWWALRKAGRQVDQILRDQPAEPDYRDAGFQRLRDAIDQHRKENPQP